MRLLLFCCCIGAFVLVVMGCFGTPQKPAVSSQAAKLDLDWPVGKFSLTERSGQTVTQKDLLGKVWVASFVFTRCMGDCPAVTTAMTRLQSELAGEPDVRLVTFTVDPGHDDPKELKMYADSRHADPNRWLFLTGDEATIHKLLKERFKQIVAKAEGPEVKPGYEFDHSSKLAVVDRKGTIRAVFDGIPNKHTDDAAALFEENLKALEAKVKELAREGGE